jgi:hypothetical protein
VLLGCFGAGSIGGALIMQKAALVSRRKRLSQLDQKAWTGIPLPAVQ